MNTNPDDSNDRRDGWAAEEISAAKRRESLRWFPGPGHPGSKSPMRPAAIKARRKRERQARRAGRRGGD